MQQFTSNIFFKFALLSMFAFGFSFTSVASNTTEPSSHLAATLELVELEAQEGDQQLQLFLGNAYLFGEQGVEQDLLKAIYWLEMAANGDPQVQKMLGGLFQRGIGFPKDKEQAFTWYMKAANSGDIEAMEAVAAFYATGQVETEQNCVDAISWYRTAAEQGSLLSRRNLVWLYATCPDPEQRNGEKALKLAKQLIVRLPEVDASDLDNLAAAYAACGEFDMAVDTQSKALASLGSDDMAQSRRMSFAKRLETYKQKQVWIDN
ncbi:tetratricopeptide repeat protein [Thaumasiovibrio sp. DFM-14]|uniref:tetratricopeptide repeat protein n=1 Tax=Thaumasiovibrio sp. DFM-14 TaxID=3384792 RepID=UPI0039A2BD93